MKRNLLIVLMTIIYFNAAAQKTSKNSFISISAGPSFPTGDFANKQLADPKAGLASTGGFLNLAYGYQFSKFFGVTASLDGKIFGVDKTALKSYALPTGSGASGSFEATTWRFGSIMAGLFQTIPITADEKFSFEIKEQIGVQFSSSPELKISINMPGVNYSGNQPSESATSFAYQLGLGFRYNLDKDLGLRIFTDYTSSTPVFDHISVNSTSGNSTVEQVKQKTDMISVGLGLVIRF